MSPPSPPDDVAPRCRAIDGPWLGHAAGRRLIFLHIPKTAGTAITSFLRQQFDEAEVMPQLQANFHRSHPLWPLVARRYALLGVGMHLDHDRVAALARGLAEEAPPFLLTVLREPRARLLSRYKEWRSTPDEHMQAARDHVKEAILTARTKSFSEFLHSDNPVIVDQLRNLQARLLAGLNFCLKANDGEVLERAQQNLACYDLVGTTTNCDDTLRLLAEAYDWPQPAAALPRVHQSQPVSEDTLRTSEADEQRIAELTTLDQALWDEVTQGTRALPVANDARPATTDALAPQTTKRPSEHPPSSAATTPSGNSDLGPGYATVQSILASYGPEHVFGLGRKKWYPPPDAHPDTLEGAKVVFVVKAQAVSHWRSYIVERGSLPTASLLAITEVSDNDPRLRSFLHEDRAAPYAALHGQGDDSVLTLAIGKLRDDLGGPALSSAITTLERLRDTHPSAVRELRDSPSSRLLVALETGLCLGAAVHLLETGWSSASREALLATLTPEDRDPLLASSPQSADTLPALGERLAAARQAAEASPTSLDPRAHELLRQTSEIPTTVFESIEACDLAMLADAYAKVFALLGGLTRLRDADRT